jgi:hypothetical protein
VRQSREVLEKLLPGTTELLGAVLLSIGTAFAVPSGDRGLHLDVAISLVERWTRSAATCRSSAAR